MALVWNKLHSGIYKRHPYLAFKGPEKWRLLWGDEYLGEFKLLKDAKHFAFNHRMKLMAETKQTDLFVQTMVNAVTVDTTQLLITELNEHYADLDAPRLAPYMEISGKYVYWISRDRKTRYDRLPVSMITRQELTRRMRLWAEQDASDRPNPL